MLGGERIVDSGPETGLHERADKSEICAYYDQVLTERMVGSGRVEFFPHCDYTWDRGIVSLQNHKRFEVPEGCRIVDARYLAADIPSEMPLPFSVSDGARLIPVNDLVDLQESPSQYVVAGSGKTAADAIVWLLEQGADPDTIWWIRPREPRCSTAPACNQTR